MPHRQAIKNQRHVIPAPDRVLKLLGEKREPVLAGLNERIEEPFISGHANLESTRDRQS